MAGAGPEPGLPPHDEAFWIELSEATWRRVRLHSADARCAVFGTEIHRQGSYYVRPAYTDGVRWLSQRGYEALQHRIAGPGAPARRYGRRPPPL
jgi:hypothetical protein